MRLTEYDIIIDVETRCDLDIKNVGVYKYCAHESFKVLLVSCMLGNAENNKSKVWTWDLTIETLPQWFYKVLISERYRKHAHNAVFEILSLQRYFNYIFTDTEIAQWFCSMACVAFCGLPLGLEDSANALGHDQRKQVTGTALINKFSVKNKKGGYDSPTDYPNEWEKFISYNKQDVLTEKKNLECLPDLPEIFEPGRERTIWLLDFKINSTGVNIDVRLAENCNSLCYRNDLENLESIKHVGIDNVNSRKQVLEFLNANGIYCNSLKAEDYDKYISLDACNEITKKVLEVKKNLALTSSTKFKKFIDTELNGKIYGTLQYYGAVRTGRWGGRGAQPQNLKRNTLSIEPLTALRYYASKNDYNSIKSYFGNVKESVTELCRTIVVPEKEKVFLSSDFSAVEARVTAWIADETWRLEVFRTHGKIYEASAAMMFKKNISEITKGSVERFKGKAAELGLGFGGWTGALKRMGMDGNMTEDEMVILCKLWREKSPGIVKMWEDVQIKALSAVKRKGESFTTNFGAVYKIEETESGNTWLTCKLPSGRRIMYYEPKLVNSRGETGFTYRKGLGEQNTWSGILVENIVQAIARDLLVEKILYLWKNHGMLPVLHVHDELIYEVLEVYKDETLSVLNNAMSLEIEWAKGLPLRGDTDILPFYMKGE